jgi:hypothetical protein
MPEELTPKEIIIQHKEDFKIIAQELLSEGLSSENLELYEDLVWQVKSIEAGMNCPTMDEYTVYWVLTGGFDNCSLRLVEGSDKERLCVQVDCPRFNSCELTKGILDKYI